MGIFNWIKNPYILLCNSIHGNFICTKFILKVIKKTYRFSVIDKKKYHQCLNTWPFRNNLRKINNRKFSRWQCNCYWLLSGHCLKTININYRSMKRSVLPFSVISVDLNLRKRKRIFFIQLKIHPIGESVEGHRHSRHMPRWRKRKSTRPNTFKWAEDMVLAYVLHYHTAHKMRNWQHSSGRMSQLFLQYKVSVAV